MEFNHETIDKSQDNAGGQTRVLSAQFWIPELQSLAGSSRSTGLPSAQCTNPSGSNCLSLSWEVSKSQNLKFPVAKRKSSLIQCCFQESVERFLSTLGSTRKIEMKRVSHSCSNGTAANPAVGTTEAPARGLEDGQRWEGRQSRGGGSAEQLAPFLQKLSQLKWQT